MHLINRCVIGGRFQHPSQTVFVRQKSKDQCGTLILHAKVKFMTVLQPWFLKYVQLFIRLIEYVLNLYYAYSVPIQ